MALPLTKLRLYLSLIPLLRKREEGITFKEVGEHLGISAQAAQRDIPEALMVCGVPPYLPHDYISCFTEGDRITVLFADHFKRPAKLTLSEVAAVLLALRGLRPARGAPWAGAVAGLIRKLESALGTRDVKDLTRRIGAWRAPGSFGKRLELVQQAMEEQRAVEIEYYTQRRRTLSTRVVRPFGLVEHGGAVYLVGRDSVRNKELSFRVDRIRDLRLTDETFKKPRSFSAQRYKRPEFYRPGPGDLTVKVRFAPEAARRVRELSPSAELSDKPKGGVERAVRTDSLRWVVDWALQYGDQAEVVGPAKAKDEARKVLDEWLAFYRQHPK